MLKDGTHYNSIFGVINVRDAKLGGIELDITSEVGTNITNYVSREFGIARKQYKNTNLINAIADPKAYLASKNNRLEVLKVQVASRFQIVYADCVVRNLKEDECQKTAREEARKVYENGVKLIDEDFPKDTTERILKLIK